MPKNTFNMLIFSSCIFDTPNPRTIPIIIKKVMPPASMNIYILIELLTELVIAVILDYNSSAIFFRVILAFNFT
jgi:hypothetical protein